MAVGWAYRHRKNDPDRRRPWAGEKPTFNLYCGNHHPSGAVAVPRREAAGEASVIMLSAEDGVADTIVPRLMAAGADRTKVKIVTAVHEADGSGRRIFNLTKDLDALEDLIIKIADVGLVIIDPVDAYIGGGVDSHKNAAVRAVLENPSQNSPTASA